MTAIQQAEIKASLKETSPAEDGEDAAKGPEPKVYKEPQMEVKYVEEEGDKDKEYNVFGSWKISSYKDLYDFSMYEDDKELDDTIIEVKSQGIKIGLNFLVPLCPVAAPLTASVRIIEAPEGNNPLVMLMRIDSSDPEKYGFLAKETNVVFTKKATISYIDFQITWESLKEGLEGKDEKGKSFLGQDGELVINFEFNHTVEQMPQEKLTLAVLMNRPLPTRKPRPAEENQADNYKSINLSNTIFDYVSTFAEMMYYIKDFSILIEESKTPEKKPYFEVDRTEALDELRKLYTNLAKAKYFISADRFTKTLKNDLLDVCQNEIMSKTVSSFFSVFNPLIESDDHARKELVELFEIKSIVKHYINEEFPEKTQNTPKKMNFLTFKIDDYQDFEFTQLLKSCIDKQSILRRIISDKPHEEKLIQTLDYLPCYLIICLERGKSDPSGDFIFTKNEKNKSFHLPMSFSSSIMKLSPPEEYKLCSLITNEGKIEEPKLALYTSKDLEGDVWTKIMAPSKPEMVTEIKNIDENLQGNNSICLLYKKAGKRTPNKAQNQLSLTLYHGNDDPVIQNIDDQTITDFIDNLSKKYHEENIILWRVVGNNVISRHSSSSDLLSTISNCLILYVDNYIGDPKKEIAIFVNFYHDCEINYLMTTFLEKSDKVGDLSTAMIETGLFENETVKFDFYIKNRINSADYMNPDDLIIDHYESTPYIVIYAQFSESSPSKLIKEIPRKVKLPEMQPRRCIKEVDTSEYMTPIYEEIPKVDWYLTSLYFNIMVELFDMDGVSRSLYFIVPLALPVYQLIQDIKENCGIDNETEITLYPPNPSRKSHLETPLNPNDTLQSLGIKTNALNFPLPIFF